MGKAQIRVRTLRRGSQRGFLELGPFRWACALGRGGISSRKREGDGATPMGAFRLVHGYYRPDKFRLCGSRLRLMAMAKTAGWCDAPGHGNYNRAVRLPCPASAEAMWRDDGLYDVVIVLDYNLRPRVQGRGSAIFLHVARPGLAPTEGCVAISLHDMRTLLRSLPQGAKLCVP